MDEIPRMVLLPLAALLCGAPARPQQPTTAQRLTQLLEQAETCLDRKDFPCAADHFHEAAQLASPDASDLLGNIYLQRSKALAEMKSWAAADEAAGRAVEYLHDSPESREQKTLTENEASKVVMSAGDISKAFRPVAGRPGTQQAEIWIPFAFNSHDVDEGRSQSDRLARYMEQTLGTKQGRVRFHLIGHTDKQGEAPYNLALSQRRAASVKTYLESKGIAAGLLSTEGRGESELRRQGDSEDDHRVNRRVVVQEITQ